MSETTETSAAKACEMFAIFTRGESLLAKLICRVTKGQWSHAAIGFRLDDGSLVYFEALVGKPIGPAKRWQEILDWRGKKPAQRRVATIWLPILPDVVQRKYLIAQTYAGRTYAEWQLGLIWLAQRLGISFVNADNPGKMVCSELLARILVPEIDLRDLQHPSFDYVTPESACRNLLAWMVANRKPVMSLLGTSLWEQSDEEAKFYHERKAMKGEG